MRFTWDSLDKKLKQEGESKPVFKLDSKIMFELTMYMVVSLFLYNLISLLVELVGKAQNGLSGFFL